MEQPAEPIMCQNAMKNDTHLNTMMTSKCISEYTQDSLELTQNTLNIMKCTLDPKKKKHDKERPHAQNIGTDMDKNNII